MVLSGPHQSVRPSFSGGAGPSVRPLLRPYHQSVRPSFSGGAGPSVRPLLRPYLFFLRVNQLSELRYAHALPWMLVRQPDTICSAIVTGNENRVKRLDKKKHQRPDQGNMASQKEKEKR
uniref:Uncharacterized protein n=1 Tax=Amphimedon queenslandica TaxID=400682 RepID=A0A1X7UKZ4_AMPQE